MSLALKLALGPLLAVQALRTRARVPRLAEATGARERTVGAGARVLRLLIVGDSSAAGVGVPTQDDALLGQLLHALAPRCDSVLHARLLARAGVNSEQAMALLVDAVPADLGIVVTGVNDVVDQVPSLRAVHHRERIVNAMRNRLGVQHVVLCPLPPIHQFPALPQPLRWMAGTDAQRHNRALRDWVSQRAAANGDVSTVRLDHVRLGADNMASDGFHPGAPVYRAVASSLADHIAGTVWPRLQLPPSAVRARR